MLKKVLITCFILSCMSYIAYAGDILWGSITNYTSTKAVKTVSISSVEPVKAITTASTCTVYLNDTTGTGYLMAANTFYDIRVPSNISNVVFSCTSSAGTTVTIIK